jgi:malate synthase
VISGDHVQVTGPVTGLEDQVLTPEAIEFLVKLARAFEPTRRRLLQARHDRQKRIDAGELPTFLPDTAEIRESSWTVAAAPADLQDRRVEITGPADRKMIINALNSGANVFMADFEDSNSPTWQNLLEGQINLSDAVRLASGGETFSGGWRANVGLAFRFRHVLFPQRAGSAG